METYLNLTKKLFRCVSEHDFDTLASMCDDDHGIIDLDPQGKNVVVHNRAEWEAWFHNLFAQLTAMNAKTWTDITEYKEVVGSDMGYSVVMFTQYLEVMGHVLPFECTTTIIWKWQDNGWVESRWHCSLLKGPELPDALKVA